MMYNPYQPQQIMGGYGTFGGGYPGMSGSLFGGGGFGGGYPQMGGFGSYGGGYPGMGGSLFGGYNPYQMGGYGGGMFGGGFLDQFQGQLDDMFSKYFKQENMPGDTPTTGATGSTASAPAESAADPNVRRAGESSVGPSTTDTPYVDITGDYYRRTGKFSKGARDKMKEAGYENAADFMQSEQGQSLAGQQRRAGRRDVSKDNF